MKFSSCLSGVLTVAFFEALLFEIASGIDCYQCTSIDQDNPFQCNEYMTEDIDIAPDSCDDVYGAAFCIKQVGRFDVGSIDCYQCSTPDNIDCGDVMIHDHDGRSIQPISCNHIFEARYCIKTTGVHGGGLGTKRFCSSLDLGNYCNYIKQPGDVLEYRSCVYTCSSDGCNSSTSIRVQPVVFCVSLVFTWLLASYFKL